MPEITNFEHNGISIIASEAPAAMGPLGGNVIAVVGTAPNKADELDFNVPYRISNMAGAAKLDTTGDELGTLYHAVHETLKKATVPIYVVIVPEGIDEASGEVTDAATMANVIGGVDAESGLLEGIAALPLCEEAPTVIAAPGFGQHKEVLSALATVAVRLRCRVVGATPDEGAQKLVDFSKTLGGLDTGYNRVYLATPMCAIYSRAAKGNIFVPAEAMALGCFAAVKPWESPGNQGVNVQDVARHFDYNILDKSTDGDLLNRYGISYFAHTDLGGFSLIGNRGVMGDFISHVGLEDAICRKLAKSAQVAMAKNMTKSFMEQEVRRVNQFVQQRVAEEVIPGGTVYLHPTLNTVEAYKNGSWYVVIDYGRYSPNEHMIFHLNAKDSIIEDFIAEVL